MTKRTRALGAALAAVAFSLFFVAGALAQAPTYTISLDKTAVPATLAAGGGSVTYWYAVSNTGTGDFQSASVTDDKCTPVVFDHSSDPADDDQGPSDKLNNGETWTYKCGPKALTATTTNNALAVACHSGSNCDSSGAHDAEATDSLTVTVAAPTAPPTLAPTAKPATATELPSGGNSGGAAMLALILLAIGGIGFLGTTNRLPKLPKFR